MRVSKAIVAATFAIALLAGGAAQATTIVIGGITYGSVGATENLTALFNTPDGGVTTAQYHNFVEIDVSGSGFSRGAAINDAFYVDLPVAPHNDVAFYQMTFSTAPLDVLDSAQDIRNFIAYDLVAGIAVTAPYVPAYEPSRHYSFVIDTGSVAPSDLHFGVSDGVFSDNGGAYQIAVTQLAPAAVPEPVSLSLLGAGLLGLGIIRRRS